MNDQPDSAGLARLKGAAPFAAAGLAIVTALVGASLMTPDRPAPVVSGPAGEMAGAAPAQPAPGLPPAAPGVAFDQAPGVAPPAMAMEIVVKFKDDAAVKDIVDAFWRDQASARSRFETFKSGKAEFTGLRLERVTYSNELVLVRTDSGGATQLAAMREIASKLSSRSDVAYAEPNMTAQPGAR